MPELESYLTQFCEALRTRKVAPRTIEAFRLYWLSLPRPLAHCPCPFCFAVGQQGRMIEQTQDRGMLPLVCETCSEKILIPRVEAAPRPPSEPRIPRKP